MEISRSGVPHLPLSHRPPLWRPRSDQLSPRSAGSHGAATVRRSARKGDTTSKGRCPGRSPHRGSGRLYRPERPASKQTSILPASLTGMSDRIYLYRLTVCLQIRRRSGTECTCSRRVSHFVRREPPSTAAALVVNRRFPDDSVEIVLAPLWFG